MLFWKVHLYNQISLIAKSKFSYGAVIKAGWLSLRGFNKPIQDLWWWNLKEGVSVPADVHQ